MNSGPSFQGLAVWILCFMVKPSVESTTWTPEALLHVLFNIAIKYCHLKKYIDSLQFKSLHPTIICHNAWSPEDYSTPHSSPNDAWHIFTELESDILHVTWTFQVICIPVNQWCSSVSLTFTFIMHISNLKFMTTSPSSNFISILSLISVC